MNQFAGLMNKEDIELWGRIGRDDDQALKMLFDLYYRPLCSYALQFSQRLPDAEDSVQGVFINLWTKRKELKIGTSLKAYLYKSVFNACMQNLRKDKKIGESLELMKWEMLQEQIEEDDAMFLAKIEQLQRLVDDLPERCREILLLSKKEGYKNREIAQKLDVSIKTVESQIRIAFKKIRKGFKDSMLVLLVYFEDRCS